MFWNPPRPWHMLDNRQIQFDVMKWYLKAALHKTLSLTPLGGSVNRLFQDRCGELRRCPFTFTDLAPTYIAPIAARFGSPSGVNVVEIGTGWLPVLPISLALLGARCTTFDIRRHLDKTLLSRAVNIMSARLADFIGEYDTPAARDTLRRCADGTTLENMLDTLGLAYRAPVDTLSLPIETESQDITVSRLVLPHIPQNALINVLREQHRILRPGGISIHRVNLHDEYARVDPGVTLINFLRYPDWFWEHFGNNPIKYVNRERYPWYLDAFRRAGFHVLTIETKLDERSRDALESMKINPRFKHYSREELATIGLTVILEKR